MGIWSLLIFDKQISYLIQAITWALFIVSLHLNSDFKYKRNINTQIFKAFLENAASEQGSRMTAMDNATRNAGDLVDKLTINYNRSRQAAITKELIEIISGAESL